MSTNNIYYVLFLIILLFVCINFLSYNHTALGSSDNHDNDDDDDNNNDKKGKEDKGKDKGHDDDVPFILPVPFP